MLCRKTLDSWAEEHPDRFKVTYILANGAKDPNWTGPTGFVSLDLFQEKFFPAADDVFIVMCGPPIMMERACLPAFEKMGFEKEKMFGF